MGKLNKSCTFVRNMHTKYKNIYFLGIGGIGMSALARYFNAKGYTVAGYDRTRSHLTEELENEGINIVYNDSISGETYTATDTLVVRTPAVPEDEAIYTYFRQNGYTIIKRAELLGLVTRLEHTDTDGNTLTTKALCVAGTHGKTTCSTMLAHIMHLSHNGASAFLGGISENYHSNVIIDDKSRFVVAEADEYDRSFHHLTPYISLITSIEPDHLDIYGTAEGYQEGFDIYAENVTDAIVIKKGFSVRNPKCKVYTYCGYEEGRHPEADFYADNVRIKDGEIEFNFIHPQGTIKDVRLGVPVWVNIENAIGAMAVAHLSGATDNEIRSGIETYQGVWRRFNRHLNSTRLTYIDDYAHHPTEIKNAISSVRKTYPDRHITAVFQPHLYTRTRDFADGFADALTTADEVILLPIYPAREKPIEGITASMLAEKCKARGKETTVVEKSNIAEYIEQDMREKLTDTAGKYVLLTLGAGDIDRETDKITVRLKQLLQPDK